jgi:hypothetical protein
MVKGADLSPKVFTIAGLGVIAAITNADAACKHPPVPWRFGQSITSEWVTDNKSVCVSTNYHPENIANIEIERKPEHGVAGKSGPFGIAYKPNPGFHGTDTFQYAVRPNDGRSVARVSVLVTVQ